MVSFQCEGCGDVLTKKKLDGHWNQCHAPYSCIDCMTTFQGTSYRAHTSCITEDQKYQGALYREKPSKASKRKSVSILEPTENNALVPRKAYVEDAPDIEHPPYVPTPPPAVREIDTRDSVFDYMVDESLPNTPQIAYTSDKGEMAMKNSAPSIFTGSRPSSRNGYRDVEDLYRNQEYEEHGFTWGAEPVKPRPLDLDLNGSNLTLEFMTPAAKVTKSRLDRKASTKAHARTDSGSEKKRKRAPTEENLPDLERDALMTIDTKLDTPGLVHSGLTGGLSRIMTDDMDGRFRPSPDLETTHKPREKDRTASGRTINKIEDPTSPLKRTRHSRDDPNGLGISIKGRAVKALSMVGGALLPSSQHDNEATKTRRRASSSENGLSVTRVREGEKRERKKYKVTRHNGTSPANVRHESRSRRKGGNDESPSHSPGEGRRKLKAIEYHKHDDSGSDSESDRQRQKANNGQMVVFGEEEKSRRRCRNFLANAPGLESEKGYSLNKMLKRWHKQNDTRSSNQKMDEEKDLLRNLRVKRNEKGEYILFF